MFEPRYLGCYEINGTRRAGVSWLKPPLRSPLATVPRSRIVQRNNVQRANFHRGVVIVDDNDEVFPDGDVILVTDGKLPSVGKSDDERTGVFMQPLADL